MSLIESLQNRFHTYKWLKNDKPANGVDYFVGTLSGTLKGVAILLTVATDKPVGGNDYIAIPYANWDAMRLFADNLGVNETRFIKPAKLTPIDGLVCLEFTDGEWYYKYNGKEYKEHKENQWVFEKEGHAHIHQSLLKKVST